MFVGERMVMSCFQARVRLCRLPHVSRSIGTITSAILKLPSCQPSTRASCLSLISPAPQAPGQASGLRHQWGISICKHLQASCKSSVHLRTWSIAWSQAIRSCRTSLIERSGRVIRIQVSGRLSAGLRIKACRPTGAVYVEVQAPVTQDLKSGFQLANMKSLLPLTFAAAAVAYPTTSQQQPYLVSLGPRPYYIVNNMTDGSLKQKLQSCENKPVTITDFTIGHRGGGTLQFPEETVQSENAGARMGAGILECDVSFTGDRGLVCRHSLCDLHTTTDILLRPQLAKKCTVPFTPANGTAPANALCCTSDITTAECTFCPTQRIF
jgi:hypothetical protein